MREGCRLEYYLDYTLFAHVCVGFVVCLFAGGLLSLCLYVAVLRVMGRCKRDLDVGQREGYGSFGRIQVMGRFTQSVASLLDLEKGEDGEWRLGKGDKEGDYV